jgi:hypothetical protein
MTDMSMTLNTNIKGLKRSEHIEERMLRKARNEEEIRLVELRNIKTWKLIRLNRKIRKEKSLFQ